VTTPADRLPDVRLDGRVALVTGSSRGLGAATAVRLAAMGASVVVTYRSRETEAAAVADAIRAGGGTAWVRPLDLADPESVDALFDSLAAVDGPGRLDVLVANAAATSLRPLLEQKPHNVRRTFAITVDGFLQAVQRSVPLMDAAGGGRIVAVSGIDTVSWAPAHGLLAAAKAAMETLVTYLNVELGPRGITAVGVNPDAFLGESVRLMLGEQYDLLVEQNARVHPLRETATAETIAGVVALLCTPAARWLSGHTVMADGAASFAQRGVAMGLAARLLAPRADTSAAPSIPSVEAD
jgi:enoyl-[acyl-carrier protein] reductase III